MGIGYVLKCMFFKLGLEELKTPSFKMASKSLEKACTVKSIKVIRKKSFKIFIIWF